ncbi:MAG: DUF2236 domain-containing protein [Actinobacteria bacterium]|nr:DUF2236 domain-containing protein [Actinomycetota bacterium]
MLNSRLTKPLADKFRENVSGSKDGRPDWVATIESGNDIGLFGPESAVWQVHGSIATLVGGVRALLLQAAHPAPLSGVAEHSRYESDPLGRLAGTTRWLTVTTFASTEVIEKEAARVNTMHDRVKGQFEDKKNQVKNYQAKDPRFLLWVHCAFTDSFLKAHLALGYPIDKGADAYVSEWSKSAVPLGLLSAPQSVAELEETLNDFRENDLRHSARTQEVVNFILNPPFDGAGKYFYKLIANAAIATLDPRELKLLGLKKKSKIWLKISRVGLDIFLAILGSEPPAMAAAKARIKRLS